MKNCLSAITAFLLWSMGVVTMGQVINDDIENRIELVFNEPIESNTTDCTLQWECLNHKLTSKCIQYHNDQWFSFKASNLKTHFINISNQECRDLRGVQVVIIDGKPCDRESYNIINCVSLGSQDDIFIELDNLKPDIEYLVLVDGYLEDFCAFRIEYSDAPKGLPLNKSDLVAMQVKSISNPVLEISWHTPDSIVQLVQYYEVHRRHDTEFKSNIIHTVRQGFNARGFPMTDYAFNDTLVDYGTFNYTIVGVGDKKRLLMSHQTISRRAPNSASENTKYGFVDESNFRRGILEIELDYPETGKLNIYVYDAVSQSLLMTEHLQYTLDNRLFKADIQEFIEKGITYYRLEVVLDGTNEKRSYLIMKQ